MTVRDPEFRIEALRSLLLLSPLAPADDLRVLELCTDPDGSSALHLADRYGRVVSISDSSRITGRARRAAPDPRVAYHRAAILSGWPKAGPYDLVLHWRWMELIPYAVLAQCQGYLISPVIVERGHHGMAIVVLRLTERPVTAQVALPGDGMPPTRWNLRPAWLIAHDDGYGVGCRCRRCGPDDEPDDRPRGPVAPPLRLSRALELELTPA